MDRFNVRTYRLRLKYKGEKYLMNYDITLKQELRLCKVDEKFGYFHCWEHISDVIPPSHMRGRYSREQISYICGVVEFPEGIKLIKNVESIKFCDEEHDYLNTFNNAIPNINESNSNKFEIVDDIYRKYPKSNIILPHRSTKYSAGYDIYTPVDITIKPNEYVLLNTDIKAKINKDEVLMLFVRSSIGIKNNIMLMTGTSIIDSDFYNNQDNGGNITLPLFNYGKITRKFEAGYKICQGIFVKYSTTCDDYSENIRKGGIGSTSK